MPAAQTGAAEAANRPPLRVLYFGMVGELSLAPLHALLAAGVEICGVVVPAAAVKAGAARPAIERLEPPAASPLPMIDPFFAPTIVQLAWETAIPVYELRRPAARESQEALAARRPDLACVSCFSMRLPSSLLSLPRHGFLNLHPSLLPAYRGPDPLFWILHEGERSGGVTVHWMDEGLDTGPIALQETVPLEDGLSGEAIEARHAAAGGHLLAQAIELLARGALPRRPQGEEGSRYPRPQRADYRLDARWSARRAFNFMRGTAARGYRYPIDAGGQIFWLRAAVDFDAVGNLDRPFAVEGDVVRLQMAPGILRARFA